LTTTIIDLDDFKALDPFFGITTWPSLAYGAAQESNLPSVGLRRRTGFEDQLGHRPQPLRA